MTRIWKWTLQITDKQMLQMPQGAKVLTAQMQGEELCLWAQVGPPDPGVPQEARTFAIYGTGNPMPDEPGEYVATFQTQGGALVFHVYDLSSPPLA